ncbi:DUF2267 domain-containing protein, partial [Streptomyces cellulosae]
MTEDAAPRVPRPRTRTWRIHEPGRSRSRHRSVLTVLAQRINPGEADDLASQLPEPLGQKLTEAKAQQAENFGIEE